MTDEAGVAPGGPEHAATQRMAAARAAARRPLGVIISIAISRRAPCPQGTR